MPRITRLQILRECFALGNITLIISLYITPPVCYPAD